MKIIGITGGVGAGKTQVLEMISSMCSCFIVKADELARKLEEKGNVCYRPLVALLGEDVLDKDGNIDPKIMADMIFRSEDKDLRMKVNGIVHPAVRDHILAMIEDANRRCDSDYFFIEAALLIEDHYELIVDEMWYIYADEDVRYERLRNTRGYSDEKIRGIMDSQSSDEVFRKHCSIIIDNSGSLDNTRQQLERYLSGR